MTTIKNVQPLDAAHLTDILKTEFPAFVDQRLGSNLSVEFVNVSDFLNVAFPEVIEGNAFTITVDTDQLELTDHTTEDAYDAQVLKQHLVDFLIQKAG
jgi:hypothetical protein